MNAIFWAAVVLGMVAFWLCCAMGFRAIGRPLKHLIRTAKDEINKKDEEER